MKIFVYMEEVKSVTWTEHDMSALYKAMKIIS